MVLPFGTTAELDPYVSHPPNIPKLHNEYERYDFPAGSGSKVHLTLTNRYVNPISNVSLKADIYELWIPENVQPIAEVQDPPWIERVTSASQNTSLVITFDIRKLEHNQTWTGDIRLRAHSTTPLGRYHLRFALEFDYNNTHCIMKSIGHYNASTLEEAMNSGGIQYGGYNLTYLGIDGIVHITTFKVTAAGESAAAEPLTGTLLLITGLAVLLRRFCSRFPR